MGTNAINDFTNLLWRSLLICIDWPQIEFFEPKVVGQICKGTLTADKPSPVFRNGVKKRPDWRDDGGYAGFIGVTIAAIDFGMLGVMFGKALTMLST